MADTENEYLWSDRKRIMGIPMTFTKYAFDDSRFYFKKGFFKSELNEILLYRILDVKTTKTLWQKIFGVGTVTLYTADQTDRTLNLINIKKPDKVHKAISKLVEKIREEKGFLGREMFGAANIDAANVDAESIDIDIDEI